VPILTALQNTAPYTPITFKTNSQYVIDSITIHLASWEDRGWINIANSDLFRATAYHLRIGTDLLCQVLVTYQKKPKLTLKQVQTAHPASSA